MPGQNLSHNSLSHFYPLSHLRILQSNKITPIINKNHYPSLTRFRQQLRSMEICALHRPYSQQKKSAAVYRTVFIGIALIFLTLMIIILCQKVAWFFSTFLNNHYFAKGILCSICALFSIASLFIGINIRTEKEAVQFLWRRAYRRICRIHTRKRSGLGWKRFLAFFPDHKEKDTEIEHDYHDAVEKMHEVKEHTLVLLDQIRKSKQLDREEKENLLNEGLLEMRDQLNRIVASFHSSH